jgi:uncharacterized protein
MHKRLQARIVHSLGPNVSPLILGGLWLKAVWMRLPSGRKEWHAEPKMRSASPGRSTRWRYSSMPSLGDIPERPGYPSRTLSPFTAKELSLKDPQPTASAPRIEGLDLARFLAFCGMVLVNYQLMMGHWDGDGVLFETIQHLHGRAAGTFVFLAGVGLGLNQKRKGDGSVFRVTLKRGVFLLGLGLLSHAGNHSVGEGGLKLNPFPADILRFYGLYFLITACFLRARWFWVGIGILLANALCWALIVRGQFPDWLKDVLPKRSAGWRFTSDDLYYQDFWTLRGAGRYLFFNGWHPVFPWVSLVFLGVLVGRLDLAKRRVQFGMVLVGVLGFFGLDYLIEMLKEMRPFGMKGMEARQMFGTQSWRLGSTTAGMYAFSAAFTSLAVVGLSLWIAATFQGARLVRWVCNGGRIALTLYIAHIWIGMNVQRWIGWDEPGDPSIEQVWIFSLSFMLVGVVFANLWLSRFKRGPLEGVMRKLTG